MVKSNEDFSKYAKAKAEYEEIQKLKYSSKEERAFAAMKAASQSGLYSAYVKELNAKVSAYEQKVGKRVKEEEDFVKFSGPAPTVASEEKAKEDYQEEKAKVFEPEDDEEPDTDDEFQDEAQGASDGEEEKEEE